MKKLISIIIPSYNRGDLLGATLDSILEQSYTNWECIVVDDGSTDLTPYLMDYYCQKDPKFRYLRRPTKLPKGANSCRNYGCQLSKGEFICWFDSDDIMHPGFLERHINSFTNSEVNISLCNSIIFEDGFEYQIKRPNLFPGHSLRDQHIMLKRNILTPEAVWRREYFQGQNQIFDRELLAAQEWEFYARWVKDNIKFAYTDVPLVFIRKHEHNITYGTKNDFKIWNYFLARLKIYKDKNLALSFEVKYYLRDYLLGAFKNAVWKRDFSLALKMYRAFILKEDFSIKQKSKAILAILTFKYFNKGSVLLQKL